MLETGTLAKQKNTDNYCVILSVDPPSRCCGWEPCACKVRKKIYTPMAKVVWQAGPRAGQKATLMAHLLQVPDYPRSITDNATDF